MPCQCYASHDLIMQHKCENFREFFQILFDLLWLKALHRCDMPSTLLPMLTLTLCGPRSFAKVIEAVKHRNVLQVATHFSTTGFIAITVFTNRSYVRSHKFGFWPVYRKWGRNFLSPPPNCVTIDRCHECSLYQTTTSSTNLLGWPRPAWNWSTEVYQKLF
jgi:hypothetical protein